MLITLLISLIGFFQVQQDVPQFKGGEKNLDDFLAKNLIYPEFSKQNCLQGTVQVEFSLSSSGKIYTSSVIKGFGTDLDKEALRIIRLTSGKWQVPAGYDTTIALVLPVNFVLPDPKCQQLSKENISAAIAAYRSYEGLSKAVLNYYDNQHSGKQDAAQAEHIRDLKEQLGYDDKFIDRLLKQAAGKLKQGDKESACEDLNFIRRIGSEKADKLIAVNCGKQ